MTFYNITPALTPDGLEAQAIADAREFIVCDYNEPGPLRRTSFATLADAQARKAESNRALIYAVGGDPAFPWSVHLSSKA